MEIQYVEFEEKLIIVINNQRVEITPFRLKDEHGNIKFGINAPRGIGVDREEIYKSKQDRLNKGES